MKIYHTKVSYMKISRSMVYPECMVLATPPPPPPQSHTIFAHEHIRLVDVVVVNVIKTKFEPDHFQNALSTLAVE